MLIGAIVGLLVFIFTSRQPDYYNSSLSLLISNNQIQETQDYRFDGYYTIQATDLFGSTVEAWLKSPEIVTNIYDRAEVDIDRSNIKLLTKIFKAEKLAPHYIEVRYKTDNEKQAIKIAGAVTEVLSEKAKSLEEMSQNQTRFTVSSGAPVAVLTKPPVAVNTVVGIIVGIILGFFIGMLKNYFDFKSGTRG